MIGSCIESFVFAFFERKPSKVILKTDLPLGGYPDMVVSHQVRSSLYPALCASFWEYRYIAQPLTFSIISIKSCSISQAIIFAATGSS